MSKKPTDLIKNLRPSNTNIVSAFKHTDTLDLSSIHDGEILTTIIKNINNKNISSIILKAEHLTTSSIFSQIKIFLAVNKEVKSIAILSPNAENNYKKCEVSLSAAQDFFKILHEYESLKTFTLKNINIDDHILSDIYAPNLAYLDLTNSCKIDRNSCIESLCYNNPKLKYLNLSKHTPNLEKVIKIMNKHSLPVVVDGVRGDAGIYNNSYMPLYFDKIHEYVKKIHSKEFETFILCVKEITKQQKEAVLLPKPVQNIIIALVVNDYLDKFLETDPIYKEYEKGLSGDVDD